MKTIFCKHYTGWAGNAHCGAGVAYESVIAGKGTKLMTLPCVIQARRPERLPTHCEKCDMPTPEEQEAEEREDAKRFENTTKARQAIVESLGGPWKKGTLGTRGVINCPVCGGTSTLRFSRAGVNGHIHAACTTDNCVSWME